MILNLTLEYFNENFQGARFIMKDISVRMARVARFFSLPDVYDVETQVRFE